MTTGVVSPKFQAHLASLPTAVVAVLVKLMGFFSQLRVDTVKSAVGKGHTVMPLEAESLQTLADELYRYLMACGPTPATAGSNRPVLLTPFPVKTNVPGTIGSKDACVTCRGAASRQMPGTGLKATLGLALILICLVMALLQEEAVPEKALRVMPNDFVRGDWKSVYLKA